MQATKTRKPAAKPVRTLKFDEVTRMLRLQVGTKVDAYAVDTLPCDDARMVTLTKFGGDEAAYTVAVMPHGSGSCTCPAGRRGIKCKHSGAIVKMIGLNLL